MSAPEPGQRHLVYFADPMCSWCYGFAPIIREIADHFGEKLPIELVMGGLRAGNTTPMREKDREYIRGAWAKVNEATGQPFDLSFFEREEFTYDTEPACRAVVTMRLLNPRLALPYLTEVASAFYAENRDVTTPEVLSDIAAEMGLDRDKFEEELLSAEARNATFKDFLTAQELGIRGFPTLIAGSRETRQYVLVTNGYRPIDGMIEALETWAAAGAA